MVQEAEARVYDAHGGRVQGELVSGANDSVNASWPPVLRYLDTAYMGSMNFDLKEDGENAEEHG